jgi:endogenous inhibitor of DNA gyrase (YacG/DUF329 family)
MVTLPCPWCEEDVRLPLDELTAEDGAPFTCPACGTSVAWVEASPPVLDLAA